jgi:hypothetical protein
MRQPGGFFFNVAFGDRHATHARTAGAASQRANPCYCRRNVGWSRCGRAGGRFFMRCSCPERAIPRPAVPCPASRVARNRESGRLTA